MTKFDGEAIGVRAGRQKGGLPTQKERKKEMEQYLKTGVHTAQELARAKTVLPTLPERDPHRPHVFMDFKVGPKALSAPLTAISVPANIFALRDPARPTRLTSRSAASAALAS